MTSKTSFSRQWSINSTFGVYVTMATGPPKIFFSIRNSLGVFFGADSADYEKNEKKYISNIKGRKVKIFD